MYLSVYVKIPWALFVCLLWHFYLYIIDILIYDLSSLIEALLPYLYPNSILLLSSAHSLYLDTE